MNNVWFPAHVDTASGMQVLKSGKLAKGPGLIDKPKILRQKMPEKKKLQKEAGRET